METTCPDPVRSPSWREGSSIHKPQFDRFVEQWENTKGDEEQRKVLIEQTRIAAGERAAVSEGFMDAGCAAVFIFAIDHRAVRRLA